MAVKTWIYRLADNVWLRGGYKAYDFDPKTEGSVSVGDDDPNHVTARYSGDPKKPVRKATDDERAKGAEQFKVDDCDRLCRDLVASKLLHALMVRALETRLGREAKPDEIAAERAAVAAIAGRP